jgi:hypothetical protein
MTAFIFVPHSTSPAHGRSPKTIYIEDGQLGDQWTVGAVMIVHLPSEGVIRESKAWGGKCFMDWWMTSDPMRLRIVRAR